MTGLTASQVQERRQQGQGNAVKLASSRSYGDIIRTNVFNPITLVLLAIAIGLALVGDFRSALTTGMLVVFNAAIGIVQESIAKRKLDQIALLGVVKVHVLRDGQEQEVGPDDLVLGDVLVLRAGDQIPVDGKVIGDKSMEVDESALTGESDLITKQPGDDVLSGSFVVTGGAEVEATKVGEESFANQLTKNARKFKLEMTPLQRQVNSLLRLLLLVVIFFGILAVLGLWVLGLSVNMWLQILSVITGSVSAGLLALITINYSWGAIRISKKGGLVQQNNAVEALANITVLCTDKTGTLTANKLHFNAVYPVGSDQATCERLLADFALSATATNKTTEALIDGLKGAKRKVVDEVPFASIRKWSALAFDDPGAAGPGDPTTGVYVLGALEMLRDELTVSPEVEAQLKQWSDAGLRVLVFAGNPDAKTLHDAQGEIKLPPLTLLGLVSLTDELRPHLQETLAALAKNNIKLKVISGDNPQTVAALARQAGMKGDLQAISGPELATLPPGQFDQAAADYTVFGRITPQQKEGLVDALKRKGEYVAMTGDGVNDVLSLKKADVGIAMQSGSSATRSVAAMVLLNNSFEAVPAAIEEGKRIIASIQMTLMVFMVTNFAMLLLIVGVSFLQLGFPVTAPQNTLLSFFARGAPPLVLAVTAVAAARKANLYEGLIHFTVPAAILVALFGLGVYITAWYAAANQLADVQVTPAMLQSMQRLSGDASLTTGKFDEVAQWLTAQTALVTFIVLSGVMVLVFAEPPLRFFAGGAPYRGHWLPGVVAVVLIVGYYIALQIPFFRYFFQLVPMSWPFHLLILGTVAVWVFVQRVVWRRHIFERFMGMPLPADKTAHLDATTPAPPAAVKPEGAKAAAAD